MSSQSPPVRVEKRPVKLRACSELLDSAKALGINLSATLEKALEKEVRDLKSEQWRKDNKKAMQALNQFTKEHGLFSDEPRAF